MSETAPNPPPSASPPHDPAETAAAERRAARTFAMALPPTTLAVAAVVAWFFGFPTGILVMAAGALVGVVAFLWASLRTLGGDAPLPEALEDARMEKSAADSALAHRKKMLLRALKDLESEHAIGKLDQEDFVEVAARYREEIKDIMRAMDDALAPYRSKAQAAAHAHLVARGLEGRTADEEKAGVVVPPPPDDSTSDLGNDDSSRDVSKKAAAKEDENARRKCVKCGASNEPDAKFCKGCGATMSAEPVEKIAENIEKSAKIEAPDA